MTSYFFQMEDDLIFFFWIEDDLKYFFWMEDDLHFFLMEGGLNMLRNQRQP